MILIRQGIVPLICSTCHALIVVGENKGYVELADVNQAEHDHQLGHLIEEHKDMEALG